MDTSARVFTDAEERYLRLQRLGRLATVDSHGRPHVVPTGFRLDSAHAAAATRP